MISGEGPVGASFEHAGKTYEILPLAYSGKGIKAMKRALVKSDSMDILEPLKEQDVPNKMLAGIAQGFRYTYPELERGLKSNSDVVAAAMTVVCPQFKDDIDAAMDFVDEYPDLPSLGLLIHMAAGVDEAGKSQRSGARQVVETLLDQKRKELQQKLDKGRSSEQSGQKKKNQEET